MVTLLGTIVRELDSQILFRVSPGRGDAALFGFSSPAEFWIKRAQVRVREARQSGELDAIDLSPVLASLKAQTIVMGGC